MKKMPQLPLALLITGLASTPTDVYCSKQTGGSSTKTIAHHFFVGIRQESYRCGQNLWRENIVKTETDKHSLNGFTRFYYFRHCYSAGHVIVLLTIIA